MSSLCVCGNTQGLIARKDGDSASAAQDSGSAQNDKAKLVGGKGQANMKDFEASGASSKATGTNASADVVKGKDIEVRDDNANAHTSCVCHCRTLVCVSLLSVKR